jgi:glycosyltransferase involved in cell wall biosynthesis
VRILHLVGYVGPESFGLGPPPLNLASEQVRMGLKAEIWCCSDPAGADWASRQTGCPREIIRTFAGYTRRYAMSPALVGALVRARDRFDVVHVHSLWTGPSIGSMLWQAITKRPTLIAPHGTLSNWALERSALKKKFALLAYERRNISRASCLLATSEKEVGDIRACNFNRPIALLPNGISSKLMEMKGEGDRFRAQLGLSPQVRIGLFLSRISPVKGLPLLVDAVKQNEAALGDWVYVIAGTDEFGHKGEIQELIRRNGLEARFRFHGSLYGQEKADAFAAADVFLLPTRSEGAPSIIVEALGSGVPVMTTVGSTWTQLGVHGCGWSTQVDATDYGRALLDANRRDRAALRNMGRNGRKLVSEQYMWSKIAADMISVYRWLREPESLPPPCVVRDTL